MMVSVAASSRGASRRRGFRRVLIGPADPRVTGHAGVAAVAELDRVLGIGSALDDAVGSIKTRRRGVSAGGLLLSMASAHLTGADFLVGMDRRCRGAAVGAGAHAGVHDHRAVGEAFRRNTSGRDRERDRHAERPGAGVGVAAAAGPVVGGGHDRWGHHRCGGVRPGQAGRCLQLSGATRLPAAYRVLGRGAV